MQGEGVVIPKVIYQEMIEHARREAPLEACGLVAGRDGVATRFFPTENVERSPVRYTIAPLDILRVSREIDRAGEELLAIFHSHPATEAYPSATDIRLAFYPDAYYLICSLRDPARPELRAFRIRDGQVTEHPVIVR